MSELNIIYEDDHLLAVLKPAGMDVICARGDCQTPLCEQASLHLKNKAFVVHRLDRPASGLVLFAKEAQAHRELCLLFQERRMHKTYLSIVRGRMEHDGVIENPIRAFGSGRMGICKAGQGQSALTRYHVKASTGEASFLELEPETGRRHQLRVHLYSLGHPILGDTIYGKERPVGGAGRLMLHAWKLAFHFKGQSLELCAPAPPDFTRIQASLGF